MAGILGYEEGRLLTVIFVGTDNAYAVRKRVLPVQTWPKLDGMDAVESVLRKYFTP